MLAKMREALSMIGGPKVVLATIAIGWGLNTIQKVVEEQTVRLMQLQEAENEILNRYAPKPEPEPEPTLFDGAEVFAEDARKED